MADEQAPPEPVHHTIDYIELPLMKIQETKAFYTEVFGWTFRKWGPLYLSFRGAGISGGFNGEANLGKVGAGVLVVLYSSDLQATLEAVKATGARISRPVFDFPGGKRFHFIDPNGSELAVWSEGS
ncbi:MAG: VOC family protein [Kordiimonadaceae bacterium]|nr:VOC family protein [Kordiimonadaceae bacterium]